MKLKLTLVVAVIFILAVFISTRVQASPARLFTAGLEEAGEGLAGNNQIYLPSVRSCQNLYFDDFSNPSSGWPVGDFGDVEFAYLNSEFRILVFGLTIGGAAPGFTFTDYLVSADVRRMNANNGRAGLIFEVADGFASYYTYEIDVEGNYVVWLFDGVFTLLTSGSSDALNTGLAANNLGVERNGNQINLFANGVMIDSFSDGTLQGPRFVGLVNIGFDAGPQDARFDNFTVLPIGCGLSVGSPSTAILESPAAAPAGSGPIQLIGKDHP